jgi:hypothetical protein
VGAAAGVDHMGLVTSEAMRGTWDRVESWMRAAVLADRSSGVAQTTF